MPHRPSRHATNWPDESFSTEHRRPGWTQWGDEVEVNGNG